MRDTSAYHLSREIKRADAAEAQVAELQERLKGLSQQLAEQADHYADAPSDFHRGKEEGLLAAALLAKEYAKDVKPSLPSRKELLTKLDLWWEMGLPDHPDETRESIKRFAARLRQGAE